MRDFKDSLHTMLYCALVSYAHVREFTIEDEAASFFVDRAFDRVLKHDHRFAQYSVAASAIVNLPRFFDRIESQTGTRSFADRGLAIQTIDKIQTSGFKCVYPWCSDVPEP